MTESHTRNRYLGGCAASIVLLGLLLVIGRFALRTSKSTVDLVEQAKTALSQQDTAKAMALMEEALASEPEHAEALFMAGAVAEKQGDANAAFEFYDRVPRDGSEASVRALCRAGSLLFEKMHRLSDSELRFRQAVEQSPENLLANYGLASALSTSGRYREALPYLQELARQQTIGVAQLQQLNFVDAMRPEPTVIDYLNQCQEEDPADPLPLIGLADVAVKQGENEEAIDLLQEVLDELPDQLRAHVLLGRALIGAERLDELPDWDASLPDSADESPDIWAIRGRWAMNRDDRREAIRCFGEALRRDPNHLDSIREFPQLLIAEGLGEQAQIPLQRSHQLTRINSIMEEVAKGEMTEPSMHELIDTLDMTGRFLEAAAWAKVIHEERPEFAWLPPAQQLLTTKAMVVNDEVRAEFSPIRDLDFLFDPATWPPRDGEAPSGSDGAPAGSAVIAFEDRAKDAGLLFSYFNGAPPDEKTFRIQETTGGGVGIVDYDSDGWPDVYFTQGCQWPPGSDEAAEHRDRLYRNVEGREFVDVTAAAGLGDADFSQGVAVGDYNCDGSPDIFLANAGRNRLYLNRGDGTFEEVSDRALPGDDSWTTSCLMADLNADALPDLYAVNFVTGSDVYDRVCQGPDGQPVSCSPVVFEPALDRVYINSGDGSFAEPPNVWGPNPPRGNGLGILAADFEGTGRLDLFIANDQSPNFLLLNQSPQEGNGLALVENGVESGAAVDRTGHNQACMGIACGDIDDDGRLDMYVTNFAAEYNTLYLRQPGGLFVDATSSVGLIEPTLPYLGWGAQFLDADFNGTLDLILTNGNIDSAGVNSSMYHMRPQFFRNNGGGRFQELFADQLGPYFEREWLGRALALVDWNRDGLEDAVVSHIDDNASLVTNVTEDAGNYVALSIVGVQSSRDAYGTTVTATIGGKQMVRQLTAGDGFHTTNERRLTFGLGQAEAVDELHIRWPSGTEQRMAGIAGNQHYLIVEGRDTLIEQRPRP